MFNFFKNLNKPIQRIGFGYDVHKLIKNKSLILCGVNIPFEKGLIGHSDADVASHAVADALLGASGLDDIGVHFSNEDKKYKNFNSLKFLEIILTMLKKRNYKISNLDLTIIAQAPKLNPYSKKMKTNLSNALKTNPNRINIKFTTEEGLGFTGKGEGISAACVTLIY